MGTIFGADGLFDVGIRKRESGGGKLTSRLLTGLNVAYSVIIPSWPKFVLIEALGPGASYSGGMGGGGWADDVICKIVNRDDPISVNVYATASTTITDTSVTYKVTGQTKTMTGLRGTYATNNTLNGGANYTDTRLYGKYTGGYSDNSSGTGKDAEYGSKESVALGWQRYTGGGRLATVCPNGYNSCKGLGQGQAASGDTKAGEGAVCITFAEDRDQLITFLNAHYLDLWGVDWRAIEPSKTTGSLYL